MEGAMGASLINGHSEPMIQSTISASDPQTLANLLQERLDAINSEIRMIQEEKNRAERAAEQLAQRSWTDMNSSGISGYAMDDLALSNQRHTPRNSPQYELMNKYNTLPANATTSAYRPQDIYDYNRPLDDEQQLMDDTNMRRLMRLDNMQQALHGDELNNDRVSPASSISSSQDQTPADFPPGTGKLKKRSTSTGGLKSLGRIFAGKKGKSQDPLRRGVGDTVAYSDSEMSISDVRNAPLNSAYKASGTNGSAQVSNNSSDFDRRKKKKHELLEEVTEKIYITRE